MKIENNTETVWEFIRDYAVCMVLLLIYFNNLVFKCIDGWCYEESVFLFADIVLLGTLFCFSVEIKHGRNTFNAITGVLFPLEIYMVLAYYPYLTTSIVISLAAAFLLIAFCGYVMFSAEIKEGQNRRKIILGRIRRFMSCSRTVFTVCLAAVTVTVAASAAFGRPLYISGVDSVAATSDNKYTIAANIDTVCMLQEDVWSELDMREKLDVMQVIANIEANYLGISTELRVTAGNLDENVLGAYIDTNHCIMLNITLLKHEKACNVLETVCHEAYHAYERRLTDLYGKLNTEDRRLLLFADAEEYAREFVNYQTDEDYYEQAVERHSRRYADAAVDDYYARIEEYLGLNSGSVE